MIIYQIKKKIKLKLMKKIVKIIKLKLQLIRKIMKIKIKQLFKRIIQKIKNQIKMILIIKMKKVLLSQQKMKLKAKKTQIIRIKFVNGLNLIKIDLENVYVCIIELEI